MQLHPATRSTNSPESREGKLVVKEGVQVKCLIIDTPGLKWKRNVRERPLSQFVDIYQNV